MIPSTLYALYRPSTGLDLETAVPMDSDTAFFHNAFLASQGCAEHWKLVTCTFCDVRPAIEIGFRSCSCGQVGCA